MPQQQYSTQRTYQYSVLFSRSPLVNSRRFPESGSSRTCVLAVPIFSTKPVTSPPSSATISHLMLIQPYGRGVATRLAGADGVIGLEITIVLENFVHE